MAELWSRLAQLCRRSSQQQGTVTTRPGSVEAVPDATVKLIAPGPEVRTALTGSDGGILGMQAKLKSADLLSLPWNHATGNTKATNSSSKSHGPSITAAATAGILQQTQQPTHQHSVLDAAPTDAWGEAASLYDSDPATGLRNGDPIADQYGIITYANGGAVMALADGVNWGPRAMWAAKAAVFGLLTHVHEELALKHGGKPVSSTTAFHILQAAVQSAQQHVLAADGTLTTLVAAVICKQWRGGKYSVLSVCIGDSPAFVWRSTTAEVEDVTYTAPTHGFHRDPRVCPGCLGYAIGDAPDLSNVTYSITTVQQGDIVFLTSDGIADNFDPVIRKHAPPRTIGEGGNRPAGVNALSPSTCHAMAIGEMAAVLNDMCRQQQQQLAGSCEAPAADILLHYAASGTMAQAVSSTAATGGSTGSKDRPTQAPAPVDGSWLSAESAVRSLIGFVRQGTAEQRAVLEDPKTRESMTAGQLSDLVASLPGKMDHASVVAYKIGAGSLRGSSSGGRRPRRTQ